ncbi:hypothetical protein P175DRAFT_0496768 [Aspergillus ochraceoroseus IBT 24754]|uniref:Glycosyltransferase 2-like domain-containing protein n=2 Tax=Aspergillus ochraceoroseus TaxID=138278 RepID=A0A2T5LKT6_9EURO|nr:uncharacterized protein P175DRAFT_0496768 [Aspergillus ochraceoroseus IBT 24754]KKK15240.1 hypothetical protein AOCH_000387 [Aspergillus ochraceoroseus]PTU16893.1 hypothetical protein P175DRAFT_0496768 [Aspergillus ochraceoroseus IBT 24754]
MSTKAPYEIQELQPTQQMLAGLRYRKSLHFVAQAAVWTTDIYFLLRVGVVVTSLGQTWQMWLMIMVEWIFARLSRQSQLLTVATGCKPPLLRKQLRLRGTKNLPRVDVLVACCGEPLDIILDTVRAACSIDYPASEFRVLLLDDGGSEALRIAVSELQSKWPQLSYHTRGKHSGRVFAKAGNLNFALFSLQEDFQPEYCVVLDSDCLPGRNFLRATLPHLLQNPQAALLTTRQHYYNLPQGDPLSQSRIHFYACHNTELDYQGIAIDAGSGAVFRRQVILDTGGYPTFSFSEDWQLSLILQGRGHTIIQVEEPLQFGLVPSSLQGHVAQRNRWNIGHSQQLNALRPPTNKSIPRQLQWSIALNGMQIVLGLVSSFVGFSTIPVLLLSDHLIPTPSPLLVKAQMAMAVTHMALTWLYAWLQAAYTGFRVPLFSHLENSWLAGTHLFAILRFQYFSSKPKGSFVTGSVANSWNRAGYASLCQKAQLLWENGVIYAVSLLLVTLSAAAFSIWRTITDDTGTLGTSFVTTLAWPPLLHIFYLAITNLWVPVSYLWNPPRYPDRASQLAKTEQGIAFPRAEVLGKLSFQGQYRSHGSGFAVVVVVVPFLLVSLLIAVLAV